MAWFESNKVSVFPSAFREKILNGKFTSEENFINIINSIVNYPSNGEEDGYIVSVANNVLTVVIHGYLFKIQVQSDYGSRYSNAWLKITVEDSDDESAANALVNSSDYSIKLDTNSQFKGIELLTSTPDKNAKPGYHIYTLQIIENNKYCERNFLRFDSNFVRFVTDKGNISLYEELDIIVKDIIGINETLTTKQNNLTTDNYLNVYNDEERKTSKISFTGNALNIAQTLKDIQGNKLYYVDANGQVLPYKPTNTIGSRNKSQDGKIISQNVYINKDQNNQATIEDGYTVFASKNAPTGEGSNGDFWFKYQD